MFSFEFFFCCNTCAVAVAECRMQNSDLIFIISLGSINEKKGNDIYLSIYFFSFLFFPMMKKP